MGKLVAHSNDKRNRPLDDFKQCHQCEPDIPGQMLSRMWLSNRRTRTLHLL